jgi:dolichyl-phosphate-mannose-protein mannosyltransferase
LNKKLTSGQPFSVLAFLDEYEWVWAPLIFTALAVFTRMWKIGLSPIVTWDEAQYATPSLIRVTPI